MTDNKLSELKAAAMAATPGPWESIYDDWSDGDDALISCESRDGMVAIAKIEGGGSESNFDGSFRTEQQSNTAFIAAANPAAVLELLAERNADKKRIAELEAKLGTPVRLPTAMFCPEEYVGSLLWSETEAHNKAISKCAEALRAAGFTVEGDE